MPKTLVEKILALHAKEEISAGKIAWIDIDVRSARDFGGANVVKAFNAHYAGQKVDDPAKTFFTFDCNVPANTIPYASNQQICRSFAKQQGIKLYDVDAGIGSHVMIEEGIGHPGSTVVGTDSHLNIMGAVGAFGQGMGDQDIAFVFKTGKTWFEIPESIIVNVKGKLPKNCTAKDLTLEITGKLGTKTALGKAIEFRGEAIDSLDLAGRITLASMATEMSAIIGLMVASKEIMKHFPKQKGLKPLAPDKDAKYEREIDIDISGMKPKIAKPPKPDSVVDVDALRDVKIDSVFIGSCTNGTYEDLLAVTKMVKGRKVKEGIMASVVPATRKIYVKLLKEGHIETLIDSGFIVSNPGCGGCASGQIGMTGKGQVQVSTSNRNFAGKQGDGDTYLASPETAAASALLGRIATKEEVR
jgi:3-isopropylmalate/(R)-2-methylmalate dehydratase large subunit